MKYRACVVVVVSLLVATLSGQLTALASQQRPAASPAPRTKKAHNKKIPTAAEALLHHLIGVVGTITSDDDEVALLGEKYDEASVRLAAANRRVVELGAAVERAQRALARARLQLREAAIAAYVTGEESAVDSSILANTLAAGSMVDVYASAATGRVSTDVKTYGTALSRLRRLQGEARANARTLRASLAAVRKDRRRADALQSAAVADLDSIKAKLLALVGPKEFDKLIFPTAAGGHYRGPDLAGVDALEVASPSRGRLAVSAAKRLLGVPYVWGGASREGVDCSGLVMLAWAAAGVSLLHSATDQWEESSPVSLSDLQPGDLLFYHFAHDGNTPITHVVMYVGSGPYGKETVIQAAHTGTDVTYSPIFFEGLVSAGRP